MVQTFFRLPTAVRVTTHEDCSEAAQAFATTCVNQAVPGIDARQCAGPCVAAKSIEDGRYIFANRAFERFSRFSRDHILGKRADEIFPDRDGGKDSCLRDRSALNSFRWPVPK